MIEFYLTAAAALCVITVSLLNWYALIRQKISSASSTSPESQTAELARLKERERGLGEEVARLQSAQEAAIREMNDLRRSHMDTSVRLASSQTSERELLDRIDRANSHISDRDQKIGGLELIVRELQEAATRREAELAAESQKLANAERALEDKKQELTGLQERLRTEFQNIANAVLNSATDRLNQASGESLANIVTPLKQQIATFQNRIDAVHTEETTQRTALSVEIQRLAAAAGNLGNEADAFAKALKGDSGMRGNWGEVRLERILQMSGLEKDREYVVQGGEFNIKNEDGRSQRPDFIILLPEDRHFIVDSKLSLVDFLQYEAAESDEQRTNALQSFLASCRRHVDELAGKDYQYGDSINSHDMVLMFMPIEGAASLALKTDPTLFEHAWKKHILIVSPGTLFLAMRTVSSIWRYERQNQNAQAIAGEAGKLYDKLAGFLDDLNDVSDKIRKASVAHDSALRKLTQGKGNALSRAQKLKSMGVSTKKEFSLVLIEGERQAIEDDDEQPGAGQFAQLAALGPDGRRH